MEFTPKSQKHLLRNKSNPKIDVQHRLWEAMRKKPNGAASIPSLTSGDTTGPR